MSELRELTMAALATVEDWSERDTIKVSLIRGDGGVLVDCKRIPHPGFGDKTPLHPIENDGGELPQVCACCEHCDGERCQYPSNPGHLVRITIEPSESRVRCPTWCPIWSRELQRVESPPGWDAFGSPEGWQELTASELVLIHDDRGQQGTRWRIMRVVEEHPQRVEVAQLKEPGHLRHYTLADFVRSFGVVPLGKLREVVLAEGEMTAEAAEVLIDSSPRPDADAATPAGRLLNCSFSRDPCSNVTECRFTFASYGDRVYTSETTVAFTVCLGQKAAVEGRGYVTGVTKDSAGKPDSIDVIGEVKP